MWRWLCVGSMVWVSCGVDPSQDPALAMPVAHGTPQPAGLPATETAVQHSSDTAAYASYQAPPALKRPAGVYQLLLPAEHERSILHTVVFDNNSFRLQEEYLGSPDSVVVTEGTWSPSQGFIWLYKDQVVRARYAWQHDTLLYVSPQQKRRFPLQQRPSVTNNDAWRQKAAEGAVLFGVGTEPFWSVEVTRHDSAVFTLPDGKTPLRVKLTQTTLTPDSTVYLAADDSLRIVVLPQYCSDGMSDFSYRSKILVAYKNKQYSGCGEAF